MGMYHTGILFSYTLFSYSLLLSSSLILILYSLCILPPRLYIHRRKTLNPQEKKKESTEILGDP